LRAAEQLEAESFRVLIAWCADRRQVGMNRPDKAGEPSMEEILASIRQIIADEPSTDQPEPAIEANPLVPQSRASKASEPRLPLADRLSGVLKGGALPATSPLGSKRPLSFDQDLADMFDEEAPANGSPVAAPKPDIRVPAGLSHPMGSHPMGTKSFVPSREESAKPSAADGAAALSPQLHPAVSEPLVAPQPFDGVEKAADPTPPKTFGFPPLRKASFYPPEYSRPVTPFPPAESVPSASGLDSFAAGWAGGNGASVEDAPERLDGLEATGPLEDPVTKAGGAESVLDQPFAGSGTSPVGTGSPDAALNGRPTWHAEPSPAFASSPSFAPETPVQPQFGGIAADEPFVAPPPNSFGASEGRPIMAAPMEQRAYPDPFAQTVRGSPGYGGQPRFASEQPAMSTAAAHHALDALAQGLAASAASAAAEPASPAIPLTPVFEAQEQSPQGSPGSSNLPAPMPSVGSMPVNRTLEDAVADMLRPMLQQWVADNMPRIIERALRTEVAATKPGQKPPRS
jgi:hypothetical protein